jgi:peptidyl-prolyl cis-trans isomerase C
MFAPKTPSLEIHSEIRTLSHPRPPAMLAALALLIASVAVGCSQQAPASKQSSNPNDPVVARVNGTDITQSDVTLAEEDLAQESQPMPPAARREQAIGYLSDVIMVAQAGEADKLADTPDFKQRMAFLRNKLLMGAKLQAAGRAAVSDEELHKVYDDAVKPMAAQEEVHARHILVETEDEAKEIVAELGKGADFATLAKEKSKDTGSADGGDLGYFTKEQMVPEFAEVAFKMYPGQVSNPVKTQFGWHIIKVEDRRPRPVPEFDKIRDQIEAFVARRAQTDYVAKLRQTAKVERLDKPAESKPEAKPDTKPETAPAAPADPAKK